MDDGRSYFYAAVLIAIFAWPVAKRVLRWRRTRRTTISIELGDTPAELKETKKKYQLMAKELRIQYSEVVGAEQQVRSNARSERFSFWANATRNRRVAAGAAHALAGTSKRKHEIRQQIAMCERVANEVDRLLLTDEFSGKKKRKPRAKK